MDLSATTLYHSRTCEMSRFFRLAVLLSLFTPLVACTKEYKPVYTVSERRDDGISTSRSNAITTAVDKCSPAIVGINVTEIREQVYRNPYSFFDDPFFERYFGRRSYRQQYEVKGVGSGFIISEDGYILTNDHVAGNASKVVVTMTDGSKHNAKVIGHDMVTDVALLKIEAKGLPFLKLANSEHVRVGEWAIAFGNPFGLFDINAKPTVTVGVISNVGVSFTQPDETGESRVYRDMLQTDAAISSGNSGGPLVNADGEVIGMNTVIYSTSQNNRGAGSIGIGFAIPVNRVRSIVDKLKKHGEIDRGFWTGIKIVPLDEEAAQYYGITRDDGILVTRVSGDSPADNAGFEPGDVIVAIDGEKVLRMDDLNVAILDGEVGQVLTVTVERGSATKDLKLTLRKPPKQGVRN